MKIIAKVEKAATCIIQLPISLMFLTIVSLLARVMLQGVLRFLAVQDGSSGLMFGCSFNRRHCLSVKTPYMIFMYELLEYRQISCLDAFCAAASQW